MVDRPMTQVDDQVTRASFALGTGVSSERIEAKARELLAQLTVDEKIEMMDGDTPFW